MGDLATLIDINVVRLFLIWVTTSDLITS